MKPPPSSTGCVRIADVDDDADDLGDAIANVVKVDELHVKRHAAQAFENPLGGVGLAVVDRVVDLIAHPLAQAAPAVEDGHLERGNVGLCALHIFVDLAELADHILNFVDKAGPVAGEF